MDKIKDSSMLLSIINSVGLVGITFYFYKQLESIRSDLFRVTQTLSGVVKKVTELDKINQSENEMLRNLNRQIKKINQKIEEIPSLDSIDDLKLDINEIFKTLENNDIIVRKRKRNRKKHEDELSENEDNFETLKSLDLTLNSNSLEKSNVKELKVENLNNDEELINEVRKHLKN